MYRREWEQSAVINFANRFLQLNDFNVGTSLALSSASKLQFFSSTIAFESNLARAVAVLLKSICTYFLSKLYWSKNRAAILLPPCDEWFLCTTVCIHMIFPSLLNSSYLVCTIWLQWMYLRSTEGLKLPAIRPPLQANCGNAHVSCRSPFPNV